MSGWIEAYEAEFTCPQCGKDSIAIFIEEGSLNPLVVETSVAGDFRCPHCSFSFSALNTTSEEPTSDLNQ